MVQSSNQHILEALSLSRQLSELASAGEVDSQDDGCSVLYGICRDCAYKIRGRAESERDIHRLRGCWDADEATRDPQEANLESPAPLKTRAAHSGRNGT
jgi:hypothetical protein